LTWAKKRDSVEKETGKRGQGLAQGATKASSIF